MYKSSLITVLCFVLGLTLLGPVHVFANTGLTIQPVKISHTIKPGESVSGKISLTNASEDDVIVEVKVEDFVPTAGAEGIQFVGRAPGVTTVRDWVNLDGDKTFTFKKGEAREIPYTINAPANAEPGSHFGVAFFKASKASDAEQQLKIGTQVGMLIFVTIPGNQLQKGNIQNFSGPSFVQKGPVPFDLTFENTGTVHYEPKGTVKISNMFGKEVGSVPIEGQVVLPTGVKDLHVMWDTSSFILGRYTAQASILDGEGNELTSKHISFWAIPIWYILGFIVTVVVLFFILKFIKSKIHISVSLKQ